MADLREELAGALGLAEEHDWQDDWGPEPRCRNCAWLKCSAPARCKDNPRAVPPLTDQRALGFALGEIRRRGFTWEQDGTNWWARTPLTRGKHARLERTWARVPATGNDREDAYRLAIAVVKGSQ